MTFGNHEGMPETMLVLELNTIDISVMTKASQVRTPTVKSNLIMALMRMGYKNRTDRKK